MEVAARFAAHSSGKGAKFTRSNSPVRVLGAHAFAGKSEALKAEAALKKLDRTEKKLAWAQKCAPISDGILDRGAKERSADPMLPIATACSPVERTNSHPNP